jgi:N utilization substance protein B
MQHHMSQELSTKSSRRAVRALVLQILYEIDVARHLPGDTIYAHLSESDLDEVATAFVRTLVVGTLKHREAIDLLIAEAAPEYPVATIAPVDRNILRLGIYELRYEQNTPLEIVINEAVELARRFGSDSSARFINGVLGNVAGKKPSEENEEGA